MVLRELQRCVGKGEGIMKPPSVQKSIDARPENLALRVAFWIFVAAVLVVVVIQVVMR